MRSPSVKGRRMGGNNISALERLCAQCQGKMARFEIVRSKGFNVYKKNINTHTRILYSFKTATYTQQLNTSNCVLLYNYMLL
jgi:lipoate synthase